MISIAIQAGGRSSRMGKDKALVQLGGKRLIEHVLDRTVGLSDDLFITTNHPAPLADLQIRLIPDETPGQGALFGLRTALRAGRHDQVLIVGCDMPFLHPALIEYILSLVGQADVIIPRLGEKYEPMLALYRTETCLPAIDQAIHDDQHRMISFFPSVEVLAIEQDMLEALDPELLSFFNINTPEDLVRAQGLLTRSQSGESNATPSTLHQEIPNHGDTDDF